MLRNHSVSCERSMGGAGMYAFSQVHDQRTTPQSKHRLCFVCTSLFFTRHCTSGDILGGLCPPYLYFRGAAAPQPPASYASAIYNRVPTS